MNRTLSRWLDRRRAADDRRVIAAIRSAATFGLRNYQVALYTGLSPRRSSAAVRRLSRDGVITYRSVLLAGVEVPGWHVTKENPLRRKEPLMIRRWWVEHIWVTCVSVSVHEASRVHTALESESSVGRFP
jgi:hypothetical protein